MLGFEPRISGVGRDRSTNWVTTTAQATPLFLKELPVRLKSNLRFWERQDLNPGLLGEKQERYNLYYGTKLRYLVCKKDSNLS